MRKIVAFTCVMALAFTLLVGYNKAKALSQDHLADSTTIYGAYNVQHDLELWMNFDSDYYHWWAECSHYAWNINTFGTYCYCNCTIEDSGNIIAQSGRAYASYVNYKWHSKTTQVNDPAYFLWRGHAYCGTEPH